MKCNNCGFDHGFIVDYNEDGEEYTFCHNCGTVVRQEVKGE
jgi:transcription initiation factor TFIIIB Brf1 subunit/transcription initiation factor TFIIB